MLSVDAARDPITSEVLLALQFRTGDEPLLPRLEAFTCTNATGDFTPFIPLFLSPNTMDIHILFTPNFPTVIAALTIARFPTLCPRIRYLLLKSLPRDPAMTEAVSEMLLACNRDTLRTLSVTCPLTEEACRFMYTLPNLRHLVTVVKGPTPLPPVALPDLEAICVEWDSGRDWLQGLRGATIGKLEAAIFIPMSGSAQIGGFLEEFQSVALSTSTQHTLSEFIFCSSQSWSPNYSALFIFKQMMRLEIQFPCNNGCSSTVNDDIIIGLAEAMPNLQILQLGGHPCWVPGGVTFEGLIVLASRCLRLSKLRIHFQANRLAEAMSRTEPPSLSEPTPGVPETNCTLTNLQVGEIPISEQESLAVGLTLLQIFPEIVNIEHINPQWKSVVETVKLFKRIGGHVHHASKAYLSPLR